MICELSGIVAPGKGLGRSLGIPTANLPIEDAPRIAYGVYAGQALTQGVWYPAVINVGKHPTAPGGPSTVEAHIIDFDSDLYGQPLTLRLIRFLRPEKKFESLDALKAQIALDIENTLTIDL